MASIVLLFVEDESCTRFSIGHIWRWYTWKDARETSRVMV